MNAEQFMQALPLGAMTFNIGDTGDRSYCILCIKESSDNIELLGENVNVILSPTLATIDNVLVMALYAYLPDWAGNRYECFYNYHGIPEALPIWINQEVQPIAFHDEQGRKRMIGLPNLIGDVLSTFQNLFEASTPWSMEQFDKAKAEYMRRVPLDQIAITIQ